VTSSILHSAHALRAGSTTSAALTEASLSAIKRLDGDLHSFVLVDAEAALDAGHQADRHLSAGRDLGPLMGMGIGIKDIVDMAGLPTRCGSPAYPPDPVARDATVVSRLRAGGAVIIGKTTAHELACGVYSAPARNPWATDRIPGGSSGGSGAAVAAGLVPVAIGSDTGGSIRIPASLCGVVGLKPTYGRVSRAGVEPLSWSLDHIGPIASDVYSAAVALGVIAGGDDADPTATTTFVDFTDTLDRGVEGARLGVIEGEPFEPMQPDVAKAVNQAIEVLASLGAVLVRVTIPALRHTLAAEFGIVGPEAAHYHRERLRQRPEDIDPGIRALLVAGSISPVGHYLKALEARRVLAEAIRETFRAGEFDALVSPTLPATAAGLDQENFEYDGFTEAVTLSYVRTTAPFNLSGLPAISVPCGFDSSGLPVGLQIAGRPFDEATVLRIAAAYERTEGWTSVVPPRHSTRVRS